jgi:hypothetical protein
MAVILLIGFVNLLSDRFNQEERDAIRAEKVLVDGLNTELNQTVTSLTAANKELEAGVLDRDKELAVNEADRQKLRNEIVVLREESANFRLSTRLINTNDGMLESLQESFPDFAKNIGLMMIEDINGLKFPYFTIPIEFTDTFVVLKEMTLSLQAEIDRRIKIDEEFGDSMTLAQEKAGLIAQMVANNESKYQACDAVRAEVNQIWSDRADKNMACLNQPRINLGSKYAFVGGAVAGVLTCSAVDINFKW